MDDKDWIPFVLAAFAVGCTVTPSDPAMFGSAGSASADGGPSPMDSGLDDDDGAEEGSDQGDAGDDDAGTTSAGTSPGATSNAIDDDGGASGDSGPLDTASDDTSAGTGETDVGDTNGSTSDDPTGASTSGGSPGCGNGIVEAGELCDGDDFDGETCETIGFTSGELMCDDDCVWDWSGCTI